MSLDRGKYDSDEEVYFSWWIDEMMEAGMIDRIIYQPKSFLLSDKVSINYTEALKTKTKLKSSDIFRKHIYTADWLIVWNEKTHLKLHATIKDDLSMPIKKFDFISQWNDKKKYHFSVIDIKGIFTGQQNSTGITFPINQKWVYDKYGIYVQKVIPHPQRTKGKFLPVNALFLKTFVPGRFLVTDGAIKARKIHYTVYSINEYLDSNGITK